MRNLIQVLILVLHLFVGCKTDASDGDKNSAGDTLTAAAAPEDANALGNNESSESTVDLENRGMNIVFQAERIPKFFDADFNDKKENGRNLPEDNINLPEYFMKRDFLTNRVGFKDKLDFLVGMVVKRGKKVKGYFEYKTTRDFKIDSIKLSPSFPSQGILIERKYDQRIGAGIKYLIASAEIDKNSALQLIIQDISELTIPESLIDKKELYSTYINDPEIENYFLIRAAVTTSILFKKFTKMQAKSEFTASAIKVDANYYSESSELMQDWKIGIQLIPLNEFLKGYVPK